MTRTEEKKRLQILKKAYEHPPKPPAHLSERSQRLWREIVPRRVYSAERQTLLQTGLEALDRLDQVREALGSDELVKVTERTGAVHANPLLRAEKDARAQFLAIWTALELEHHGYFDNAGTEHEIDSDLLALERGAGKAVSIAEGRHATGTRHRSLGNCSSVACFPHLRCPALKFCLDIVTSLTSDSLRARL